MTGAFGVGTKQCWGCWDGLEGGAGCSGDFGAQCGCGRAHRAVLADAGFGTTSGGAFGTSAFGSANNTGSLFGSTQTKPGAAGRAAEEGGREGGTPRTRNYQQKLAKHPPKPRTAPIRAPRQNEQPVSVCRRAVWLNHLQPASHLLHQHWLWLWNIHRDIKQPLRNHQHRWEPLLVAEQCLCTEQAGWVWK